VRGARADVNSPKCWFSWLPFKSNRCGRVGLRELLPNLVAGKVAFAFNTRSVSCAIAECQADPQQILSLAFLLKLALVALTAAGIHDALRRERTGVGG
jgi:hypothetical protein